MASRRYKFLLTSPIPLTHHQSIHLRFAPIKSLMTAYSFASLRFISSALLLYKSGLPTRFSPQRKSPSNHSDLKNPYKDLLNLHLWLPLIYYPSVSVYLLVCKYVTEKFVWEGKNGNYGTKLSSSVQMLRFLYELCGILVRGGLPIQSCNAVLERVKRFKWKKQDMFVKLKLQRMELLALSTLQ